MVSKREFEAVAEILKKYAKKEDVEITTIPLKLLIEDFCKYFKTQNQRFDEERFREYILG